MDRLKGFTDEMQELGREPSSEILARAVVSDRLIASIFRLPSTARFFKLVRVRRGDGIPASREMTWYNLGAAPALLSADLSGSVYAYLAEHCGVPLIYCHRTIEAAAPTAEECDIFGFSEPVLCLLIKRCSYTHDDKLTSSPSFRLGILGRGEPSSSSHFTGPLRHTLHAQMRDVLHPRKIV